jgi:hypothetical protein
MRSSRKNKARVFFKRKDNPLVEAVSRLGHKVVLQFPLVWIDGKPYEWPQGWGRMRAMVGDPAQMYY